MREYAVVYEKTPTGWSVYCPDLPGLASSGATFDEAQAMMREALDFHLEGLLEDGYMVPEAATRVGVVPTEVVEHWPQRLAKTA